MISGINCIFMIISLSYLLYKQIKQFNKIWNWFFKIRFSVLNLFHMIQLKLSQLFLLIIVSYAKSVNIGIEGFTNAFFFSLSDRNTNEFHVCWRYGHMSESHQIKKPRDPFNFLRKSHDSRIIWPFFSRRRFLLKSLPFTPSKNELLLLRLARNSHHARFLRYCSQKYFFCYFVSSLSGYDIPTRTQKGKTTFAQN